MDANVVGVRPLHPIHLGRPQEHGPFPSLTNHQPLCDPGSPRANSDSAQRRLVPTDSSPDWMRIFGARQCRNNKALLLERFQQVIDRLGIECLDRKTWTVSDSSASSSLFVDL